MLWKQLLIVGAMFCSIVGLPCQVDWALQHHVEYAFQNIQGGSWKPLQPLPEKASDSHSMPPPPELLLLSLNSRDNSLKFPEKVLAKWHDHGEFAPTFRAKYAERKTQYPLDIPQARLDTGESCAKKNKLHNGEDVQPNVVKLEESNFKSVADLKPLHHKTHIVSSPKLTVEVCVGQSVYITNRTEEAHIVKSGVQIAGYWKGKFWSTQGKGKDKDKAGDASKEVTASDIPFQLQSSESRVTMSAKVTPLSSLMRAKREVSPADAVVAYHTLKDQPTAADPKAFVLTPKPFVVYWRADDFKAKTTKTEGESEDGLVIPAAHLAGTIPYTKWRSSKYCELIWAVKWPTVGAKGLQPVRPLVSMSLALFCTKFDYT